MPVLDELFDRLWGDYASITPQAAKIHALLEGRGERLVNDHVALRTFDHPSVSIETLDRVFVDAGYEPAAEYEFPEKKLLAYHYEHPEPAAPKIFISALLLDAFSPSLRKDVDTLLEQLPRGATSRASFVASGRPWNLNRATYSALVEESEYAGWLAAFGFRANHFTVDVNRLKTFETLEALTAFLQESGFRLNDSGGVIKGTPEELLQQASTRADEVEVEFEDGVQKIPSCYYEFAKRYPLPDGRLFQGFIARSADKLFESTDR
jgi:hypothetical protein